MTAEYKRAVDALSKARYLALVAWGTLQEDYVEKGYHKDAARAQAATHLPREMRRLLMIDRYGSASLTGN